MHDSDQSVLKMDLNHVSREDQSDESPVGTRILQKHFHKIMNTSSTVTTQVVNALVRIELQIKMMRCLVVMK